MAAPAFLFNWQVLPRIGGRATLARRGPRRAIPLGILLYPLSVLGLVLAFREELWMAAAVWGLLAFGDGMASVVGHGARAARAALEREEGLGRLRRLRGLRRARGLAAGGVDARLPWSAACSRAILRIALPLAHRWARSSSRCPPPWTTT